MSADWPRDCRKLQHRSLSVFVEQPLLSSFIPSLEYSPRVQCTYTQLITRWYVLYGNDFCRLSFQHACEGPMDGAYPHNYGLRPAMPSRCCRRRGQSVQLLMSSCLSSSRRPSVALRPSLLAPTALLSLPSENPLENLPYLACYMEAFGIRARPMDCPDRGSIVCALTTDLPPIYMSELVI